MMMNNSAKKMILLLPWVKYRDVHLKKDTGLFPVYIAKEYNIPVEIVFTDSDECTKADNIQNLVTIKKLPNVHNFSVSPNFSLFHLRRWIQFILPYIKYIKKNRNEVSHYMFFHATDNSLFLAWIARKYNKSVKTWVKLDANLKSAYEMQSLYSKSKNIKRWVRQKIFKSLTGSVSLISTESTSTFDIIANAEIPFNKNICLIPDGVDYKSDNSNNQKEKIMITVCRLGATQKNIPLLFSALEKVDLKDWKFYLIGSNKTEDFDFNTYSESFFNSHPQLKDKIIALGNISDKKILENWYRKSSVFVMPSKQESFCIAALEAAYFENFLILSDFSSAKDFVPSEHFGFILPESKEGLQNEKVMIDALAKKIQQIADGYLPVQEHLEERKKYYSDKFLMKNIVRLPAVKNWIENK